VSRQRAGDRASQGEGQFFTVTRPCAACHGTGVAPAQACPDCHGEGVVERTRTLSLSIPEGTESGAVLRLARLGAAGTGGGPPGDLLVHVSVRPDPHFRREGNDVHSEVPVPMAIAALGGKVPLRTLRGQVKLSIPPGTSSGAQLKLRGQGIRGGDHVARVMVTVPGDLSPRQRSCSRSWGEAASEAACARPLPTGGAAGPPSDRRPRQPGRVARGLGG